MWSSSLRIITKVVLSVGKVRALPGVTYSILKKKPSGVARKKWR